MSAQVIDITARGDLPNPGEHVVIHLTGTPIGATAAIDTHDARANWTITKEGGWYRARNTAGIERCSGTLGALLNMLVRAARGDD